MVCDQDFVQKGAAVQEERAAAGAKPATTCVALVPLVHAAGSPTVGTPQGPEVGPGHVVEGEATGGQQVTAVGMVGYFGAGRTAYSNECPLWVISRHSAAARV